ncbi:nitrite reductase [Magnetospirillum aberrantis]|uniref:C-type cytochrome n=1 Tax=Magnetospirillum aberrantis SpK TaxID=908842 RepID=A0A7C9UVH4_9PROT|nr:nitrite reductase [Magnetospirillum aberrantis]NFV81006.1 c-type cytochrome [Magnetospirillum aberrantis SpK]
MPSSNFIRSCRLGLWTTALSTVLAANVLAADIDAEKLFQDNCATCHGAHRQGFIAPALTKERLQSSPAALRSMIMNGVGGTLMPPWVGRLSDPQIRALASYIKTSAPQPVDFTADQMRASLSVLVDEKTLPSKPTYAIDKMDDLMAVMVRGRYAKAPESKTVFFDGKTNRMVGEVPTGNASHVLDYHPKNERWAYVKTDQAEVYKIDLYSMQAVRKIKTGLNGPGLAVSSDGKYVMASSFVPPRAVILDSDTLEVVKVLDLQGVDPDGKNVRSEGGSVTASPYGPYLILALERAGQVWIIETDKPDLPVTKITDVGRHLHDSFVSKDGRYYMVASYADNKIVAIDLKEKKVVRDIQAGCQPHVGGGSIFRQGDKYLGVGTNIGQCDRGNVVTIWDMKDFSVVKQVPVAGPTESPAAHPNAPYVAVDIVGTGPEASQIQFIDKKTLEVAKTIEVGGHAYFPEYTADGRYLYVSAGYSGDKLIVLDSKTLEKVAEHKLQAPGGIFSHARPRFLTRGLEQNF